MTPARPAHTALLTSIDAYGDPALSASARRALDDLERTPAGGPWVDVPSLLAEVLGLWDRQDSTVGAAGWLDRAITDLAGAPMSDLVEACALSLRGGASPPTLVAVLEAIGQRRWQFNLQAAPPGDDAGADPEIDGDLGGALGGDPGGTGLEGVAPTPRPTRGLSRGEGPPPPGPDLPGPESPGPESPGPESPGPESPGPDLPGQAASRTAYPLLTIDSGQPRPEVVVLEQAFDVTAGLSGRGDADLVGSGRFALLVGQTTDVEVVLVYDPVSLIPQGPTRTTLHASDADPHPRFTVPFVAAYGEDLPGTRRIGVQLLIGGQLVALAWRSFAVVEDASDVGVAPVIVNRERTLLELTALVGESRPDLVVAVTRADSGDGRFVWTAYGGVGGPAVPDLPNSAALGGDVSPFALETRRGIQFSTDAGGDYLELAGRARRIGRAVPAGIAATLRSLVAEPSRTQAPTLLLLTEELIVPWELADIGLPTTAWGGDSPFLGAHVAIGRWPLDEVKPRPVPRTATTVRSAAVLTADYTGVAGWGRLDAAMAEADTVAALFSPKATPVEPELWTVIDLLRGTPPADVIHVALHGQFDAQGNSEGIVLLTTDAAGQRKSRFLTAAEVETGDLTGGPLVFLNACQVGSDERVLGSYGGFASTLLRIGAAVVVAPLWNVDDVIAAEVAAHFYARTWVEAAESPAEVVRQLRARYTEAAVRSDPPTANATLAAFQVFGHPCHRLTKD